MFRRKPKDSGPEDLADDHQQVTPPALEIDSSDARITGPQKRSLWGKLKRGLNMTHTELIERIGAAVQGRGVIDEELLEQLEESLIAADLGVETSLALVELLRSQVKLGESGDVDRVREILIAEVTAMLEAAPRPEIVEGPRVTLVVGINGAGKTTSIAKLARYSLDRGESVLLAAADTFRAAAIEQLQVWGQRLEVPVVAQKSGSDPAAVVFDALQAARARKIDHVIVDTAGRLHTKSNLMEELAKIGRVVAREAEDRRQQTLLVIDATNGQNAIQQAREFSQTVPVDSVFLTKLDGTAKGGVVVAVARDLKLPVLFLGVGEQADDLVVFEPASFARALFE